MRPTKLVMKGFGPFLDLTEIDLDKLGKEGLYLIHGNTGSGKTTIFDAISYAIFGETSSSRRKSSLLFNENLDPGEEAYVELSFEHNDKSYLVKRKLFSDSNSKAAVVLTMPDGEIVEKTAANKELAKIVGINHNQFAQIVLLAQGDFLKVLDAKSSDRIKLFRKIFKTEVFEDLEHIISKDHKTLVDESNIQTAQMDTNLSNVHVDPESDLAVELANTFTYDAKIDVVKKIMETDKVAMIPLKEQSAKLTSEINKLSQELTKYAAQKRIEENLSKFEKEYNECVEGLKPLEEDLKAYDSKYESVERVEANIRVLEADQERLQSISKKNEAIVSEKTKIDGSKKKLVSLDEELVEVKNESDKKNSELETLETVGVDLANKEAERASSDTELTKLLGFVDLMKKVSEYEEQLALRMQSRAEAAIESSRLLTDYSTKFQIFTHDMAGVIAKDLKDGDICPVCGEVVHIEKLKVSEEIPSEDDLKKAKMLSDKANNKLNEISSEVTKIETQIETLKKNILDSTSSYFTVSSYEELDNSLQAYISEVRKKIGNIENEISELKKKEAYAKKLKQELLDLGNRVKEITDETNELTAAISTSSALVNTYAEEIESTKKMLSTDDSFEVLTDKINLLEKDVAAYKIKKHKVDEATRKIESVKAAIEANKENLKDRIDLDEEEYQRTLSTYELEVKEIKATLDEISGRISFNSAFLTNIESSYVLYSECKKKLEWLSPLYKTISGDVDGKLKVKLEAYVQTAYFNRIIGYANARLKRMSNNKYEFVKRNYSSSSGKGFIGLDLDVRCRDKTIRQTSSLSGGESFMAALSLALGLADELQAANGGIKINTMFIDEGFGTLDRSSLELAMSALTELSKDDRLIGIISHVDGLKEWIPEDKILEVKQEVDGTSKIERW